MIEIKFYKKISLMAGVVFALFALSGCTSFLGEPEVRVSRTGENVDKKTVAIAQGADPQDDVVGRKEHARIISSFGGVYENRKTEIMVAQIASKLLIAANIGNSSFSVTLLDSPEVNAFALPGGYIYVTRGTLALANDESELAAVLAHEISHVVLRHGRDRTNRAKTSQIVDRVITGVLGGDIETDQGASRSRLSLAAFSQSQELSADKKGVAIAGRAGFDPYAAGRLLNSMSRLVLLESESGDVGDDFLSTHPSTPDRIQKALDVARSFGDLQEQPINRETYLRAIDGLSFGLSGSQGVIVGQKFIHPDLKFTFSVPKKYTLQNSQVAVVGVAGESEALRFDSAHVPTSVPLVDYLKTGWIDGLDPQSVKKLSYNNIDMAMGKARTSSWEFIVYVVRFKGEVYRFIFAAKQDSASFKKSASDVIRSFREVNSRDISKIKKSYVKTIIAKENDTISSLSKRMSAIENSNALFLVLNNLYAGDKIIVGRQYKIIVIK